MTSASGFGFGCGSFGQSVEIQAEDRDLGLVAFSFPANQGQLVCWRKNLNGLDRGGSAVLRLRDPHATILHSEPRLNRGLAS